MAEGIEGGGPGGVARLFASETSWLLRTVPGHAVPAHIFGVGSKDRAHAHQNHLPSSLMGFPDLSQHIGLAARLTGLQQWPHGDKRRILVPLGQFFGQWILQVFTRGHQVVARVTEDG